MCIRDRYKILTLNNISVCGLERLPRERYEIASEIQNPDAVLPVSYTHLRAHETVLDLVCRLLLEKKKKQI